MMIRKNQQTHLILDSSSSPMALPPVSVHGPLPFLTALYRRFQTVEFLQADDVSVTPDPRPGGPGYLFVRHLAQILFVMGGPTSR